MRVFIALCLLAVGCGSGVQETKKPILEQCQICAATGLCCYSPSTCCTSSPTHYVSMPSCADTHTDTFNCGGCGNDCSAGGQVAGETCSNSCCSTPTGCPPSCPTGSNKYIEYTHYANSGHGAASCVCDSSGAQQCDSGNCVVKAKVC